MADPAQPAKRIPSIERKLKVLSLDCSHALDQLKAIIASNEVLSKLNLPDTLLRRSLWAKKMNAKAAETTLEGYCHYHLKLLGNANARLHIWQVHAFLLKDILRWQGSKDVDGYGIIHMRWNAYRPQEIPESYFVRCLVYLLDEVVRRAETVEDGVKVSFIVDMREWGWENFSHSFMKTLLNAIDHAIPVSVQKFVLVEPSEIFTTIVWGMITPYMTPELAGTFQITNKGSVLKLVDRANLPSSLDGEAPEYDAIAFIKEQYRREGFVYTEMDESKAMWGKMTKRKDSNASSKISSWNEPREG
ncbi:CRAL-TRIO domain-containing protein [Chytriomyces sp. MP71]|nr:CRAL-TRIO domain-containing protein [Chytriomyces sp. MP71]